MQDDVSATLIRRRVRHSLANEEALECPALVHDAVHLFADGVGVQVMLGVGVDSE